MPLPSPQWEEKNCFSLEVPQFLIAAHAAAAAAAKSLQSCPTLSNPIDGSPPGSPVPGILQARTLEWVAISFSNAWKWKVKVKLLSQVQLLATPWTAAYQAPLVHRVFQARVLEWGAIAFCDAAIRLLYFYQMMKLHCIWYSAEEGEPYAVDWESWLPSFFHVFILLFL